MNRRLAKPSRRTNRLPPAGGHAATQPRWRRLLVETRRLGTSRAAITRRRNHEASQSRGVGIAQQRERIDAGRVTVAEADLIGVGTHRAHRCDPQRLRLGFA